MSQLDELREEIEKRGWVGLENTLFNMLQKREAVISQVIENIHLLATSHQGLHLPGQECPPCRWSALLLSTASPKGDELVGTAERISNAIKFLTAHGYIVNHKNDIGASNAPDR
jgi:hypothetical protein